MQSVTAYPSNYAISTQPDPTKRSLLHHFKTLSAAIGWLAKETLASKKNSAPSS
jgi:hypothetical protein